MNFEALLDLEKKDLYSASKEVMGSIDPCDLQKLAANVAGIKEQDGIKRGKDDDILKVLLDYMDWKIGFPKEYQHEHMYVHNNAFVQGVLINYYMEPQMTPSVTYEWCIEKFAEIIGMPKVKEDPAAIRRLAERLKVEDVSLIRRDGQFRMIASQGSGINAMRVGKGCGQ